MAALRLQVALARAGVDSRRKCEQLITDGHVRVNGRVVRELGSKVDPERDRVLLDGTPISFAAHVYLLLHKPRGTVTTLHDPEGRPTVMDLIRGPHTRLFPVGRLDFNTEGALLLTNDGTLAHALMHPSRGVSKTYHAKLKGTLGEEEVARLAAGVTLDDGAHTRPAVVKVLASESKHTWLEITLKEGKNRQIHRMGEAIGHPVLKLTRVRYGPLTLDDLRPGQMRPLEASELAALRRAVRMEPERPAPHPRAKHRR